jgi:hypothetical protein
VLTLENRALLFYEVSIFYPAVPIVQETRGRLYRHTYKHPSNTQQFFGFSWKVAQRHCRNLPEKFYVTGNKQTATLLNTLNT